ncbi:hypothetical protein Q1695_007530 [Nippostrongylus brasiliensis]|nr:hypothetical protein Q1695_007530 [Nippostrongylus brasiliensis]
MIKHPSLQGADAKTNVVKEALGDDVAEGIVACDAVDSLLELNVKDEDLEREEWYHGYLPFEDIVGLLKNDGDFLIRGLDPDSQHQARACVTARWDGQVRDIPIRDNVMGTQRSFTMDGNNTASGIITLVRFHHTNNIPVNGEIPLQNPIPKQKWELTNDKITLVRKVGSGQFGEVFEGIMHESPCAPPIQVAIKQTKVSEQNKAEVDEMYREARIMRQYKHKNVVTFYGVVLQSKDSVMIVMEFINGGCLKEYLKANKNIPMITKIDYAVDAAVGLCYLHSKSCMHRDVACRNCLIDVKKNIVKISDFGMSKQGESYAIPPTDKLAIKWQAPEVICTRIYTIKSDVYSYGILIWEIFHNGETPYKGIELKEIRRQICNPNFRPPIDPSLPQTVKRVMKACWRADPAKRPTMSHVARYLIHAPQEA